MLDLTNKPQGELLAAVDAPQIGKANTDDDKPAAHAPDVLADAIARHREIEAADLADETDFVWVIPSQLEITTRALTNGGVEIWQDGQFGADEAVTIHVAAHNAVQLARSILWAAGFKTVLIATGGAGGWSDVEDGDTPDNFPAPTPRPEPKAMTPDEIEALAKRVEAAVKGAPATVPEPEPEPDWSLDAPGLVIAHQPGIRVYTCRTGSVAMRQFDPDHDTGEDPIITVTPHNVPALVKALQAEAARAGT
jgi:hypothetical protein